MNMHVRQIEPSTQNGAVQFRPTNKALRPREYLTADEIDRLMKAARASSRYGHRDATIILIGYRHGLRASEIADLRWSQIELGKSAVFHVRRAKGGTPSTHPLRGDEQRALRQLRREFPDSDHVFVTERGAPFTTGALNQGLKRIASRIELGIKVHIHMLRHGCGYALANAGHDTRSIQGWLGHSNIQHTVKYTELSPRRFDNFWR